MFDGHNVFFDSDATYGKCWGMKEYMDHTNTQVIIVAVECNHSPDNGRLKEYAPFSFYDARCGSIAAKGAITMDWMVHTLKPQIDRDLRTLSDREHTFIAGSSMGGLMSLYAVAHRILFLAEQRHCLRLYGQMSSKLEQLIRRTKIRQNTVIYMDYGSIELEQRQRSAEILSGWRRHFPRRKSFWRQGSFRAAHTARQAGRYRSRFLRIHFCTRNKEYGNTIQKRIQSCPGAGHGMQVYGHKGRPVLFIPCQDGRFFDFENFHMTDVPGVRGWKPVK